MRFPAVTVCNLNMIRSDKLPEDFIDRLIDELTKEGGKKSFVFPSAIYTILVLNKFIKVFFCRSRKLLVCNSVTKKVIFFIYQEHNAML